MSTEVQTPAPTVDDLQRELLAICKGRNNYETWARVTGQPVNMRVDEMSRIGKTAAVDKLRRQIHALNPDAALYFGWCHGESRDDAQIKFYKELSGSPEARKASKTPLYDLAMAEFPTQRLPMLLWQGLVKQVEKENTKLKADHAAYVEGSETAFGAVVEQKKKLTKRVAELEQALLDHQRVMARMRVTHLGDDKAHL